jgi:hypothetical protein
MMSQEEIEEFLYKYKSTNMIFVNDKDKMKYDRILLKNIDLKNRLDKIKEYINDYTVFDGSAMCKNDLDKILEEIE